MTHMNTSLLKRVVLTAALCALGTGAGFAQTAEDLRLTVGKSVVIDYPSDVRQISTSNPDILDASPVTTREILLHAKGLGSATMVVWAKTGERMFYNVTVDLNLDPLRKILRDSFPNEQITPDSSRDALSLNGKISSQIVGDRAVAMASTFAKTVINNLEVAAPGVEKQILLRVRFAELDRQKQAQYGINIFAAPGGNPIGANTGQFGAPIFQGNVILPPNGNSSITTGGSTSASSGSTTATISIAQALNIFAFDPRLNLGAFIKALQSDNILQILAEPNLVTTNGKEAYFLVGGEFPVPILQGGSNAGSVTVQFREFGIRLRFTPVITANGTIKMHLNQEVSTIDTANGVTVSGFAIPALSTRRAETDVELGEGQSFVIAGLLDNRERDSFSKLPILSSLPILGSLFKTKDENKLRTELLVIVTPEITVPLNASDAKPNIYFPRDFLVRLDPNDVKNGKSRGKKN